MAADRRRPEPRQEPDDEPAGDGSAGGVLRLDSGDGLGLDQDYVLGGEPAIPADWNHHHSDPVLVHLNCSARRMGFEAKLRQLAAACASEVVLPAEVKCCGFGGDRGFVVPELNAHALRKLHAEVPAGCCGGYSSNQTCEIGLTHATGLPYRSIVHLLDECSAEAARLATC